MDLPHALTHTQLAMIRRYLVEPESYCNFEFQHFTLHGAVDSNRLYAAWRSVLERYPILHTALGRDEASLELCQIRLGGPPPVRVLDSSWGEDEFLALLERRRRYRVDPRHNLFELTLWADGDGAQMLVNAHHMVYDGWSTSVLLDTLLREYRSPGREPLPPCAPFAAFADYQRRSNPAPLRDFYRRTLAGYFPPRRSPSQPVRFGSKSTLNATLSLPASAVRAAAGRLRVTPASMFTALWARETMRLYGQNDVVIGVVFSCRGLPIPALERCVGPLLNVLPLRVRAAILEETVRAVHRDMTALQEMQHLPFDYLELGKGIPCLTLDSVALFQNYPALSWRESDGLRLEHRESVYFPDNEITFEIRPSAQGAAIIYRYDNRRFTPDQLRLSAGRVCVEAAALCRENGPGPKGGL